MPKRKLPPKVHERHGRWFYVHQNKWHPLCKVQDGLLELHRCLSLQAGISTGSLASIFQQFSDHGMSELKPDTVKQYRYFLTGILATTFGHMMPSEVNEGTVAQYLEARKKADAPIAGNRERACLSAAFEYAMRNGLATRNPCRGVRRNRERPDKTLLESATLSDAINRAPSHFAPVLQFGYLTGVRKVDIVLMPVTAVTPRGIEFTESKTSKPVSIAWTPALRKLVDEILAARAARRRAAGHDRLFTNRFGLPLTEWGITSNMRRLNAGFSFRKIRPKAQTDAGDRNVLGHVGQMRERYTRRRKLVPVH